MSGRIAAVRRSVVAGGVTLLLGAGVLAGLPMGAAAADSAPLDPADPVTPATVSADPLPTVQINGVAWAQVVVGTTVYVTGDFTRARPAGAAPGTAEVVRNNLLAYDIRTGELITSFAPSLNAQGRALAASPDGSRIYVGGDFTAADGQSRYNVAAYSTATGALVENFRPAVGQPVRAIAATGTTVYLGGDLTSVGGVARTRLAAVAAANGSLLPWAPQPGTGSTGGRGTPSNTVLALVVTGGGSQVVVAGRFATLNGVAAVGVGALDPVTGATRPFAVNQLITNQGSNSAVHSLTTDGSTVYGTGYDFGGPGNFEGSFAAAAAGGALTWANTCLGDTYSSFPMNGVLYQATHAHNCARIGGFPEQNPRINTYGTAVTLAAAGTTGSGSGGLSNKPAPKVLPWWPTFYAGTFTGQGQAGWTVAGNSDYVVYGGEFPGVNGSEQQGLVRFAVRDLAPNKVAPRATGTFAPTVGLIPGAVRVSWRAVSDRDNEFLTYRVYRDSDTVAPVCETTGGSEWWRLPTFACPDTSAAAGAHRYLVTATDAFGNKLASTWTTATVGTANRSAARMYGDLVRADGAQHHWPLGEATGSTAYDRSGSQDLTVNSGVTRGRAGAIASDADTAVRFSGALASFANTSTAVTGPQRFSVEAWFQTTSTTGGKIVGFGNSKTGLSSSHDRSIYMDHAGRVLFGVYSGANRTVSTTGAFNDGRWHHAVGTLDASGMAFYVDGVLVGRRTEVTAARNANGYWRIGGDSSWSGTYRFTGTVDEVAVYPMALTAAQVAGHATAGRTGKAPNAAPTGVFTASTVDLTATFDASGSTDRDGAVRGYAWTFGDGSTGTGATASHSYATAGTYTVLLTVTDDNGATATSTTQVRVTAPPPPPPPVVEPLVVDTFERAVPAGWGPADSGGVWTMAGSSAVASVTGGAGQLSGGVGRTVSATMASVSRADVAVQAEVTLPQAPTGGGTYLALGGRKVAGTDYRATVRFQSSGLVDLRIDRVVDGTEMILATQRLAGAYTPGTALAVRLEIEGTSLRAKAWTSAAAEPTAWTVTATDTTAALQRPGSVFLELYTVGSSTRPQAIQVDNARVFPLGAPVVGPGNAAPTAEFTATTADLTVSVDGSGATDGDGAVVSYGWDFGDGTPAAAGMTATHTYATAGTYTVTLTVTDDDGATADRAHPVTVTAPPQVVEPSATDAFERTVATGWGSADRGGAWTMGGSSAVASVAGGAGRLSGGIGRAVSATLAGVALADVTVQAEVTLVEAPTGGGTYLALGARRVGTTDYRATLRYQSTGLVDLRIDRTVDGVETILATQRLAGTYAAGTALTVRLEIDGATLRAKAWTTGMPEPTAWTVTAADTTTALQRPGAIFLELYTTGSSTRPQGVRVDGLWVTGPGETPAR